MSARIWTALKYSLAAASLVLAANAHAAFAQVRPSSANVLRAEDVLRASAQQFPQVLEALATRRAMEGRSLAARGAFDLVFEADSDNFLSGFYDGQIAGARVSQQVAPYGAKVYGGYRVSRGSFPVYQDQNFTNRGGEAKLGVLFSLLRDRTIDERRFAIRDADLSLEIADLDLILTRIGVQHGALTAYYRWVAAGRQLAVFENLVLLAVERQKGLEREVAAGARATIVLTENRQNLTRRRVRALEARQVFLQAGNDLSFYYRDEQGRPILPGEDRLPLDRTAADALINLPASTDSALNALASRPDLARLDREIERTRNRIDLARNELLPRLDARYELSNDFGAVGLGGASRDGVENVVGLQFSAPLQRRTGRGRLATAQAEAEALQQRRRQLRDAIEIELTNIVLGVDMAGQRAILTAQEVEQAGAMQQAEIQRFRGGASDFFLVNLREEAAADALVRLHLADLERAVATANFLAATVDAGSLFLQ